MKTSVCITWLLCCLSLQASGHPPSSSPGKYSQMDPTARTEPATLSRGQEQLTPARPSSNQQARSSDPGLRKESQRLTEGVSQGLAQGLQDYFTPTAGQPTPSTGLGVQYAGSAAQPDPYNSYHQQPFLYSGVDSQGLNYNRGASYTSSPYNNYASQPSQTQQNSASRYNDRPHGQFSSDLVARRPSALAPQQPEVRHEGQHTASVSQWFRKDHLPNKNSSPYQIVDSPSPSSYYGSSNAQHQQSYPSSSSQTSSSPSYQSSSTGQDTSSPSYQSSSSGQDSSSPYYSSSVQASPSYYTSSQRGASSSPSSQTSSSPSYYTSSHQASSPSYYGSAPQQTSSTSSSSTQTVSSPSYLSSTHHGSSSPGYYDQISSSSYLAGASRPSPSYLNHNSHLGFNGGYFGDHFDFNEADSLPY